MSHTCRHPPFLQARRVFFYGWQVVLSIVVLGCGSAVDNPRDGGATGGGHFDDGLTAADILARMASVYQQATSYVDNAQYHQRYVLRDEGLEHDVPSHMVSVIFERPGRLRITRQVPDLDTPGLKTAVTSNGEIVRAYVSNYTGQVLEYATPEEFEIEHFVQGEPLREAILPVPLENLYPQVDLLLSTEDRPPRILDVGPAERLKSKELGGAACYRIQLTRPGEGARTLWIDEDTFLLRRMEMPTDAVRAAMDTEEMLHSLGLWIDFHDASLDVAFDTATFEMSVPDGATRVRQLIAPPESPDPLLGETPDGYSFSTLDGQSITKDELAGKVVVLDFWFTGCRPCQMSVPALEALYQEYRDVDRFAMYAVSVDPARIPNASVESTLERWGGTMPVLRDPQDHGGRDFHVVGWPTTLLVGPKGRIQRIARGGQHSYDDWHETIDTLLAGEDVAEGIRDEHQQAIDEYQAQVAAAAIERDAMSQSTEDAESGQNNDTDQSPED